MKVTLVGDTTVGKTTIATRMSCGFFPLDKACTVGVSFVKLVNDKITYEMWDTAGQERYLSLTPFYFRKARIVIFVFDVNNEETINCINHYHDSIKCEDCKIIIIGNKTDLLIDDNHIKKLIEKTDQVFSKLNLKDKIYGAYFISAKNGKNFDCFLNKFYECGKTLNIENPSNDNLNIIMANEMLDDGCC